jgi:serine/threonine protein kinase
MKQVCLQCGREAPVGGLWCQESHCATDDKPTVLEYGESLGEMSIVKAISVLPAATVYRAERAGEQVLLKVAHEGAEERLQRESAFLLALIKEKKQHPVLPTLLPAYLQADLETYPSGMASLGKRTAHYLVMADSQGEPLRDILLKDAQPWHRHAVWVVLSLADAIALMHTRGTLHLALSPEMVLLRRDRDGIPRPLLLDLGALTPPEKTGALWRQRFSFPAYRAPELLRPSGGRVGAFSDVYGLGLILHEMLSGGATYPFRMRSEAQITQNVLLAPPRAIHRPDLDLIPQIAERAISKDYRRRPPDVGTLAGELQAAVPPVPKERKGRRFNWAVVGSVAAAALAVVTLLLLAALSGG